MCADYWVVWLAIFLIAIIIVSVPCRKECYEDGEDGEDEEQQTPSCGPHQALGMPGKSGEVCHTMIQGQKCERVVNKKRWSALQPVTKNCCNCKGCVYKAGPKLCKAPNIPASFSKLKISGKKDVLINNDQTKRCNANRDTPSSEPDGTRCNWIMNGQKCILTVQNSTWKCLDGCKYIPECNRNRRI